MHNIHLSSIILATLFIVVIQPLVLQAQCVCNGSVFGVPVCTGFCVESLSGKCIKESIEQMKQKIRKLSKSIENFSDSIRKGSRLWVDSFGHESFSIHGRRGDSDSLRLHFYNMRPESKLFKNKHPKERTPIKDFNGWYIEKLANLQKP
jgi:hypothetical protein